MQQAEHLVDYCCGFISGVVQVIVMQPFEIVKVRLVNQSLLHPEYAGIWDCCMKIRREEGLLTFYKGTLSPLLGVCAQVSLQFGSNEQIKKILKSLFDLEYDVQGRPSLHTAASGMLTGVLSALLVVRYLQFYTPIDHMRIQLQKKDIKHEFHGSVDAGIKIYKKYGLKGLYLGFCPTLLREVIALGLFFTSYDWLMRFYSDDGHPANAHIVTAFFAGGIAGGSSWLFTYPIDYIKTLIQSYDLSERMFRSSLHCAQTKYKEYGIRTFFKGLGVAMLRSFPVNGFGFLSFEYSMRLFGRKSVNKTMTQYIF